MATQSGSQALKRLCESRTEPPRTGKPVAQDTSEEISTKPARPSTVASTAEKVHEGEYFQVEDLLDSRRRGRRVEYLVKWEGYGHEHDSWEPVAHFERCPKMLQQFHQRMGRCG
ncbi:hypothetical protein VTK26DRAFT_2569 [Humicola hyalothermophila]